MVAFQERKKTLMKRRLIGFCKRALIENGWSVSDSIKKRQVYKITKGSRSILAAIRTTQDRKIAFARTANSWETLPLVDVVVVAATVEDPRRVLVYMLDANEMLDDFNRAYDARRKANHTIQPGNGMWVALYNDEENETMRVGGGAGARNEPIAEFRLSDDAAPPPTAPPPLAPAQRAGESAGESLTIAEAKTRLARTLDVDPSSIKITVEA